MANEKKCTACLEVKDIDLFYKSKRGLFGRRSQCKTCCVDKAMARYSKEERSEKFKKWLDRNHQYNSERKKQWVNNNRHKIRKYDQEYRPQYYQKCDPQYLIARNLRSRLYKAFKNNQKTGSAIKDLGCSVDQLKFHLEHQFQEGMTWDNYGKWHIDHIRPLSSFDLTKREELLEACHYTNLQPLWAEDNLRKSDNER